MNNFNAGTNNQEATRETFLIKNQRRNLLTEKVIKLNIFFYWKSFTVASPIPTEGKRIQHPVSSSQMVWKKVGYAIQILPKYIHTVAKSSNYTEPLV